MYRLKHKKQPYLSSSVDIQTSQSADLLKSADFGSTSRDYARPWTSNTTRLQKSDLSKSKQQRPMTANSSFQVFNAQRLMRDTIYRNSQKPDGVEMMKIVGKVSGSMPDSGFEDEFISTTNYARKKSDKPGVVRMNSSINDVTKVPAYVKLSSPEPYKPMKMSKQFVPIAETIDLEDEILGAQVSIKAKIPTKIAQPAKKFDRVSKFAGTKIKTNNSVECQTEVFDSVSFVDVGNLIEPGSSELPVSEISFASQVGLPETARNADFDLSAVGFPVMN